MLEHGGRLLRAARTYGIAPADWLDLSTGISPWAWPVPPVPTSAWMRLPEDDDGLADAACRYYGAPCMLPVAGSQAAIQALPWLRPSSRVGVIAPGYAEHVQAWRRAGHDVTCAPASVLLKQWDRFDVIVLIHPNNPGGDRFDRALLLDAHAQLANRGGWLVVDEAFMDATPDDSLCAETWRDGLIVLRSTGKFFGLAGARAGFVAAHTRLLDALREQLGPWTLSGPTRHVVQRALSDDGWHVQARAWLHGCSDRLAHTLVRHGLTPTAGCAFFQWWRDDRAESVHRTLARQGILTRLFDEPRSLRFGLPGDDAAFQTLEQALQRLDVERVDP
ncbi:threonine-phosphate decarboxylase CobD [Dyella silvae]|uniref:threonine-phosphate decarboxylase CobD n=1 Tax=Dyella silvae TaxID=2994424 RepID=UPI002265306B|nr:threonine-phosphate decarboxylase CobD [Dyella silvae]